MAVPVIFMLAMYSLDEKRAPYPMHRIVDHKKAFSTINQGNTLRDWPSEEIKKAAGKRRWRGWEPRNGMVGEVVHSWGDKILLKMTKHYCVISKSGTRQLR
jgi:hypothetical protein